ncbi:MAG: hypothetical protein JST92_05705 [Deltaproteobacteria bacterium]|nr:hypothetical protein [Deltaproteobacteria bacterium]
MKRGLFVAALAAIGCGLAPQGERTQARDPQDGFDLGAIVQRAHFAFRPDGDDFTGGHQTYAVRVSGTQIAVTPRSLAGPALTAQSGAPLTLSTSAITRGDADLDGRADVRVTDEGSLELDRGHVRELVQNTPDGLEQSWAFDARPDGDGDLIVRVGTEGQPFVKATASGLHFRDPASPLGVLYGHAEWIDATGLRTSVASRYVNGAIELTVPHELVETSAYPATLDPTVSGEFGIDNPVLTTSGSSFDPSVTFDGTNFFAVWSDFRATDGTFDIYGTRISKAGTVLDPIGIPICIVAGAQYRPAVSFDGNNYFVAWVDYRGNTGSHIYGARVSKAGTVVDPAGINLSGTSANQLEPAIAFDGANYLVVWNDDRSGSHNIYGAQVSRAGAVLQPGGVPINTNYNGSARPAIAFDGTNFMVTWQQVSTDGSSSIIWARVTRSMAILDPQGVNWFFYGTTNVSEPAIAFDGNQYLIVYSQANRYGDDQSSHIYGTRVDKGGILLSSLRICASTGTQSQPAIASDDTDFVVAWVDWRNNQTAMYAARVSKTGDVALDQEGNLIEQPTPTSYPSHPALAYDGAGGYLTVYNDGSDFWTTSGHIYGARLTKLATLRDYTQFPVSTVVSSVQARPAVAWSGSVYLAAWEDHRADGQSQITAVHLTPDGQPLEPYGFALGTLTPNDTTDVSLAWTGEQFIAVFSIGGQGADQLGHTYYNVAATVVPTTQQPIYYGPWYQLVATESWNQMHPAVSCASTSSCLIAWESSEWWGGATPHSYEIEGRTATVDGYGDVTTSHTPLWIGNADYLPGYGELLSPKIDWTGAEYFVVFTDDRGGNNGADIWGVHVAPDGTVANSYGSVLTQGAGNQTQPALAFDGTNHLLVWSDDRAGNQDVYAERISAAGAVLDPGGFAVSTAANDQLAPTLTFDGTRFFAAWQDRRNNQRYGVYGTAIDRSGAVAVANGSALFSDNSYDELTPALPPAAPSGSALMPYVRYVPSLDKQHVRARLVTLP